MLLFIYTHAHTHTSRRSPRSASSGGPRGAPRTPGAMSVRGTPRIGGTPLSAHPSGAKTARPRARSVTCNELTRTTA